MGLVRRLRCGVALLIAAAVGACAHDPGEVAVGIGTAAYGAADAEPYAALYLPYARMAALAYTDPPYLTHGARPNCPDAALLRTDPPADAAQAADRRRLAAWDAALARHWQCLFGGVGPLDCPRGTRCVDGLQYQVWRRRDCREAVIAFRGSDGGEFGDWVSNLRWFAGRAWFDEYDQVQKAIPGIIDKLAASGCRPRRILAAGHSLGGGLAQHVAFADNRIDYVYAFDPSPVTGFFGVPLPARRAAAAKLGVDRVYESGEILSLPRYLVSGVFPTSPCRPRVRIVRFATVRTPSLLERHRIATLTEGLERIAGRAGPPLRLPTAYAAARTCTFAPPAAGGEG